MAPSTQDAVASYVTDMIALEEHIQKAFAGQLSDNKTSKLASVLQRLNTTSEMHTQVLRDLAERREQTGQGFSEVVKKAASSVLGVGAAAIDLVRTEKVPKNLRDDYTAICLATVGYAMLHTTATAVNDTEVSEVAYECLKDYAQATMTLFNVIPYAVVDFLREEGHQVDPSALEQINENLDTVWQQDENS